MAALLALLTSVLYGTGDFIGGLTTKRNRAIVVLFYVQVFGGLALAVTMPLYGATFAWRDVLIGVTAGWIGLLALGLLYRGLARGPMAVVAPLTALTSAVVPVVWDLAGGTRPSGLTGIGMVVGLIAIAIVSSESNDESTPVTVQVVVEALLAGCGFGLFFAALSETSDDAAPWPVLGSRISTITIMAVILVARKIDVGQVTDRGLLFVGGLCDTGANVVFLFALRHGSLAAVAVLSSLYPAATVVWARLVLKERLDGRKILGLATALAAVGLIAGG